MVLQAPAPELPVERGRPGPGLLAHVLVSKYCDGLPLYRLSGILAREGVEIERQTLADRFLLRRMDIIGISNVGGHGHGGVLNFRKGKKLRFADFRRLTFERGDLHEVERQLRLLEDAAPRSEQRFFLVGVNEAFVVVRLALIPDRTAEGEGHERMDHGIVERGGRASTGSERLRLAGDGGHGLFFLQGGLHGLLPLRDGSEVFFMRDAIRVAAGQLRAHIGDEVFQLRHGIKALEARPWLDACAAPGGVDETHRHLQHLMQMPAKVVGHGGKLAGVRGVGLLPAAFHIRGRFHGCGTLDIEHADLREVGSSDLLLCIRRLADGPLHV